MASLSQSSLGYSLGIIWNCSDTEELPGTITTGEISLHVGFGECNHPASKAFVSRAGFCKPGSLGNSFPGGVDSVLHMKDA